MYYHVLMNFIDQGRIKGRARASHIEGPPIKKGEKRERGKRKKRKKKERGREKEEGKKECKSIPPAAINLLGIGSSHNARAPGPPTFLIRPWR